MNRKFGLGKGLGALIPEEEEIDKENSVSSISINLIKANKNQPRKNFEPEKISELAESIKEHGVIQPIVLKKEDNTYSIIAGERRWRAAKSVGLKEIPAVVMELDEKSILEISLIENIQREDLNPIEEALAYKRLISEFKLTQEEISKKLSKSRTTITNCMRLLNLDERVQEYLVDEVISEGHGRAILGVEDKDVQYEVAQIVIDEGLNVRQTEKYIKNIGNKKEKNIIQEENNPYYKDIKSRLENHFDTKVFLSSKGKNKGSIQIEYYSEDDLQRILEIIKL